jgi:uncharacterized integral membrane protein
MIKVKKKKFRLQNTAKIATIQKYYLQHYKKKGCLTVVFNHNKIPILDVDQAFASLGVCDMDVFVAMENGTRLN